MRLSHLGQGAIFAAFALLFFTRCSGMHPEELDCEEAVAYLEKCCPGFHPSAGFQCVQDGCINQSPAISQAQSSCIRAKSCESLVLTGVCAAASTDAYSNGTTSMPDSGVPGQNQDICR